MLLFVGAAALLWFFLNRKPKPKKNRESTDKLSKHPDHVAALAELKKSFRELLQDEVRTAEDGRLLVIKLYNMLLEFYGDCGAPRLPHVTPDEFTILHYSVAPSKSREMRFATKLFCQAFYGKRTPTSDDLKHFIRCIDTLSVPLAFVTT
jgi:hypothetical protein